MLGTARTIGRTMLEHQDHDHDECRSTVLARADLACARRGLRLTPQRRRVLAALLESHVPASAYEIMDRLAEDGGRPAPISIYRALDFLTANGFAHRIESRNAFVACSHVHDDGGAVVFLLCERCGAAGELEAPDLMVRIAEAAQGAGFAATASVIEIRGACRRCREAQA